jgi:hypothetical protein
VSVTDTVDVHVHPFESLDPETLVNQMDRAGIDLAVLLAIDIDPTDVARPDISSKILKRLRSSPESRFDSWGTLFSWRIEETKDLRRLAEEFFPTVQVSNRRVKEWVDLFPDRFLGFGSVNPSKERSYVEDGLEQIAHLQLAGVKVLPTVQFFNPSQSDNFLTVCEFCESQGIPLMCHTGCDPGPFEIPDVAYDANPRFLDEPLTEYGVQIIMAHTGSYSAFHPGIWLEEALNMLEKHSNAWADVSAVPFLVSEKKYVEKICSRTGFGSILFGSDYPAVEGRSIIDSKLVVERSAFLSAGEKRAIMGENATELLDL